MKNNFYARVCCCIIICYLPLCPVSPSYPQDTDMRFSLDVNSNTVSRPRILNPHMDLSGRGFHSDASWPQQLASPEALDRWEEEVGFSGMYRLQFNLWELSQLEKEAGTPEKLLENYEAVMRRINDAGGVIILDIFSTPPGLGAVLDRKSSPIDLKKFKTVIKQYIRRFSCEKRYTIWYEVWSAPDLDDFFLGRKQEYLNLYRIVAESVMELREETKIHIPIGGPSSSFWFQNFDGNTVVTPEQSLIYELIKFCYHRKLPLDFITWHAYSTDPRIERDTTRYNKSVTGLIRDWLSYFSFARGTPLIVDEWNYDSGVNVLPERGESAHITASYIFSRIRNMYEAGIDSQLFFSLEDFQNNKEGVNRNVGVFRVGGGTETPAGGPKAFYNIFRMMTLLGKELFPLPKSGDEFVGLIGTKTNTGYAVVLYNYIDPDIFRSAVSQGISALNPAERKKLLGIISSETFGKIKNKEKDIASLRVSGKLKALLTRAQKLEETARKMRNLPRNIKIDFKNLKDTYVYRKYVIDAGCESDCPFVPAEEKKLQVADAHEESLSLSPYSVVMLIFERKPPQTSVSDG
ncbi:MAG: hypothetical protein PHC33_04910, partial [Candidatus Omnitrophica bacterium]|nr:hypothetical protein [Candidatus Omnitrophota bacterium]